MRHNWPARSHFLTARACWRPVGIAWLQKNHSHGAAPQQKYSICWQTADYSQSQSTPPKTKAELQKQLSACSVASTLGILLVKRQPQGWAFSHGWHGWNCAARVWLEGHQPLHKARQGKAVWQLGHRTAPSQGKDLQSEKDRTGFLEFQSLTELKKLSCKHTAPAQKSITSDRAKWDLIDDLSLLSISGDATSSLLGTVRWATRATSPTRSATPIPATLYMETTHSL